MAKRRGRPSAAQTPAPKSDKLVGSTKNKAGSATAKGSSKIDLSDKTLKSLKQKLDDFKKNNPKKKNVSLNDLKAVYRRGSGAFSTSHRPNMNRAGWSYARVNKFLKKAAGQKVKAAYVQDDDLLKYEDGGLIAPNGNPSNLTPEQYKLVRTPEFKAWFGDWENDPENASQVIDDNGEPLVLWHYAKRLQYELDKFYTFKVDRQLGSHFGTIKQAQNLKYIPSGESEVKKSNKELSDFRYYQVFLNIKNPIRLKDVGIFETKTLLDAIGNKNIKTNDWEYINNYNKINKDSLLDRVKYIIKNNYGYDGAVYLNRYESDAESSFILSLDNDSDELFRKKIPSAEDSWIAFFSNQIKLADGSNTTFDESNPDVRYEDGGEVIGYDETLKASDITESEREEWRDKNKVNQKQKRIPEVKDAATLLKSGDISQNEYIETVRKYQPIKPFTKVPEIPTLKEIIFSLNKDKVARGVLGVNYSIKDGTMVATRLDIPAYEDYDTWVVSVHDANKEGLAMTYGQTAVLKNVQFKTFPSTALSIAIDKSKSTIGRMFGEWVNENPKDVRDRAIEVMDDKKWIQVGMNPFRHSWFYDKKDGLPILSADEVIQVGALVLAKNAIKTTPDNPIFIADKKSGVRFDGGGKLKEEGGLIAPNGKPSNLTPEQYKLVRTPEFKAWFGDWENDPENASKVVDENGEPLVLHRGNLVSQEELGYTFNLGQNFLKKESGNEFGFFFSNEIATAKKYMLVDHFDEIRGGSITSVFIQSNKILDLLDFNLKIGQDDFVQGLIEKGVIFTNEYSYLEKKILDFNTDDYKYWGGNVFDYFDVFPELRNLFLKNGFSSVIFYEMSRKHSKYKVYVAFNSNQIKLADGSNTTFDSDNPDIRYAEGGKTFNDKELLAKWKKGESIGFTAEAHLKAKGLIPRADGEKRKSEKYMEDGGETPELEVVVIQQDSKLENDAYDVIRYGELGNTGKARLALLEDEKLVGAIYVEPAQEYTLDGKQYVDPMFEYKFDIYVKKSKRGKGYSKILLDYMIADFLYNFDDDCDQIRAEVINKKLEVNLEKNYGFNCDSMNDENITYCYLSREDAKKISKKLKLSKLTMETKYAEGGKVKRKLKAKGDCYRAAADFCMGKWFAPKQIEFVGTPYLVHAEVKGQGMIEGIRYGHAWIEDDVNVYDFSNNREVILPKEIYYILGDVNTTDPKKYQKYTFEEARAKMLETKHYGSWDIETEYAEGGETEQQPRDLRKLADFDSASKGAEWLELNDDVEDKEDVLKANRWYELMLKNQKEKKLTKKEFEEFKELNKFCALKHKSKEYSDGGETSANDGEKITCINCSWQWNTSDSEEFDKYVCHKCGFDNSLFYSGGVLKPALTLAQIAEANLMKDYLKPVSIEYLQEQLIKGVEHEMEHTDNEEIATTIALHHLAERPDYYVELEKLNLEEGGELEDVIVENNSPKEIEIAMFLQEEKSEAQDVMTCHDTKIFKAMMCKAKVEIADNRMSNTENPEELNVWQAYKNIWQDCLDRIVTGNLPPAREYKEGGQPCGCGQKYSKGGLAYGNSHDKGGMPMKVSSTGQEIEIEGGEGVINKRSMKSIEKVEFQGKKMTPCEVVSKINQIGGGVKFKCEEVSEIIAEDGNF